MLIIKELIAFALGATGLGIAITFMLSDHKVKARPIRATPIARRLK